MLLAILITWTVACSSAPDTPAVGGVSQSEADALNEAAAMLDNQTSYTNINLNASGPAR
jgi:hypothetical protein